LQTEGFFMGTESNYTSASAGGIKRGDRADTGDLEARPNDGVSRAGSGVHGGGAEVMSQQIPVISELED
jgi:hypothetical protein